MKPADIPRTDAVGLGVIISGLAAALVAGAAAAVAPPQITAAAIFALAVVMLVALHPPLAAYMLLAMTPLLAGLDRGLVLPLLRPHEAVAVLVAAGLLTHIAMCSISRTPAKVHLSFGRIDRAILLLAFTGSILPLVIMVARDRPIAQGDVLYALQVWKYYALFLIVRSCITTPAQVRKCLWVALGAAAVVALVGMLQVLRVGPVETLITRFYVPESANNPQLERGTSTLASSIAVADVMVFSLAIAAGMLLAGDRRRPFTLAALCGLFIFGTIATGQFSGIIAIVVGIVAFGWITGRLGRSALAFVPIAGVGALLLRPVIERRLSGFEGPSMLPQSWQVRLDNLTTYFWPVLQEDYNWLSGVRPLARVEGPAFSGIQFVWIESGYIWLLWTGGIAFAVAFVWFLAVALRAVARVARARADAIGVAGVASFTALVVTGVLMLFDPHLTLRGSADLSFSLLALASVAHTSGAEPA